MTEQDDHLVLFMPSGKRGRFPKGTMIIEAARDLGVYVESVCGGRGICGRCQIDIQEGQFAKHGITSSAENVSEFSAKETRYAEKRELKEGRRLSCSSTIEGDLVVDIPQEGQVNAAVVRKVDDGRIIERNPAIQLCYVEVEEPDMHKPLGDLDRLKVVLEREWGFEDILVSQHLLPVVQRVLREGEEREAQLELERLRRKELRGVVAALCFFAVLLILTTWQVRESAREAEREAELSRRTTHFLVDLFTLISRPVHFGFIQVQN